MVKRLTKEEFIEKARLIHGDKYDYSLVDYVNNDTKVKIICPKHGEFEQKPSSHTFSKRPKGCKKCGEESKLMSEEDFYMRLETRFPFSLFYDKLSYKSSSEPLEFICLFCGGKETISPKSLIQRQSSCKVCSHTRYLKPDEYITRFEEVHGIGDYDYSKVVWRGYHKKIHIVCPRHPDKDIRLTPYQHLQGQGCKYCKGVKVTNTAEFIEEANKIHDSRYDYSLVNYTTSFDKVEIICFKHGSFHQIPNSHLRGNGCPKCADEVRGWTETSFINLCIKNNNGLGIFYVLRCYGNGEEFYKIGITSRSVSKRYKDGKLIPYTYEIVYELEDSPDVVFGLEKELKYTDEYKRYKYTPMLEFDGSSECYDENIIKIIKR